MCRKINILVLFLFLVIPATALCAAKGRIKHLTSITGNKDTGVLGLLGGVFFDENRNRLYVTDTTNGRILAFDTDFKYISEFTAGGALESPTSIVKDSKGRFFVAEPTKGHILVIDIVQKSMKPIDFSAVPEFNPVYPGNMAVDSADRVYVVDKANQRILVFAPSLEFERQIQIKGGHGLGDVKVDTDGRIYALSTTDDSIRILDNQGNLLLIFGKKGKGKLDFPVSLAVHRKGLICVVDQHKHNVAVFNKMGEFLLEFSQLGWREGRLHYPSYIYVNKAGRIFIVDRGNNRVSIFE